MVATPRAAARALRGASNGHVAIYQGIPVSVLGYDLSHVDVDTGISADAAKQLSFYANLDEGINANSYDDAAAIVEQIRSDIRQAQHAGGGGG